MYNIIAKWKELFAEVDGIEMLVNKEQVELINLWYEYDWENFIETQKARDINLKNKISKINSDFDTEILEYFSNNWYSQAERETFSIQQDEASYIDGKNKPSIKESLFIRTLAEARWEDFQELASKIKVKAEESKIFIAQKLAEKQLKIKQLQNASN